jgi:hypothetical protein
MYGRIILVLEAADYFRPIASLTVDSPATLFADIIWGQGLVAGPDKTFKAVNCDNNNYGGCYSAAAEEHDVRKGSQARS